MIIREYSQKETEAIKKSEYLIEIGDEYLKHLLLGLIENDKDDYVKDYIIGFFDDCGYEL